MNKKESQELMNELFNDEFMQVEFIPDENFNIEEMMDDVVGLNRMYDILAYHTKHYREGE